jgi:glycosyltransferase involved in cell wall biosynthesis
MAVNIKVLILTYNEIENIRYCIESVKNWAEEVIVVDSGSTDGTVDNLHDMDIRVEYNHFKNFSSQRNFALSLIPKSYIGWIIFLDADEFLPREIKKEIGQAIKSKQYSSYYLNRRFIWMGKWIKRGYYPSHIIRLFRNGHARCELRSVNEHLIVDGETGYIKADFIHECHKPISYWIEKHIYRAQLEADELLIERNNELQPSLKKGRIEAKRWIRLNIWQRLPIFLRPFMFFFYRLFIQGAILDGKIAFGYHFLQCLWFTMLIDIFYLDQKINKFKKDKNNK